MNTYEVIYAMTIIGASCGSGLTTRPKLAPSR
jgi:hypothetical protein